MIGILVEFFEDSIYRIEIKQIIKNWIYQVLKWTVDFYYCGDFEGLKMPSDSLYLITELMTFNDDTLVNFYLINNISNFSQIENMFFKFMEEKRADIEQFIYLLARKNAPFLDEVFDDATHNDIQKELDDYTFL